MRLLTGLFVLVTTLVVQPVPLGAQEFGEWAYVENENPVSQEAEDFVMYATTDMSVGIGIKCFNRPDLVTKAFVMLLDTSEKMQMVDSGNEAMVSYRIGDHLTRQDSEWEYSQSKDTAGTEGDEGLEILQALLQAEGSETLGLIVKTSGGARVTSQEISLQGAQNALGKLSCAPTD